MAGQAGQRGARDVVRGRPQPSCHEDGAGSLQAMLDGPHDSVSVVGSNGGRADLKTLLGEPAAEPRAVRIDGVARQQLVADEHQGNGVRCGGGHPIVPAGGVGSTDARSARMIRRA